MFGIHSLEKRIPLNTKSYLPKPLDGYCFACGPTNPSGLRMEFYVEEDCLYSESFIREEHQGWMDIAHGGIVSTILDETMSWAVLYFKRNFIVTKSMEITFVRPLKVKRGYLCRARVLPTEDPKEVKSQAVILSGEGKIMARSLGRFRLLTVEEMKRISPRDLKRMEAWFALLSKD